MPSHISLSSPKCCLSNYNDGPFRWYGTGAAATRCCTGTYPPSFNTSGPSGCTFPWYASTNECSVSWYAPKCFWGHARWSTIPNASAVTEFETQQFFDAGRARPTRRSSTRRLFFSSAPSFTCAATYASQHATANAQKLIVEYGIASLNVTTIRLPYDVIIFGKKPAI